MMTGVMFFAQAHSQQLMYDRPAAVWTEALPVGNGRLGGMVYGGVRDRKSVV